MSESNTVTTPEIAPAAEKALRAAIDAGVFYGRSKRHTNPRMKNSILYTRNGMEVLNLNLTIDQAEKAESYLQHVSGRGGTILFVCTQPAFADIAYKFVEEYGMPAVLHRWIGGLMTNYPVVSKRIKHLTKLRKDLATGVFDKYVKKERTKAEQEMEKLEANLGTLEELKGPPDVLLVIDPVLHSTAIREANRLSIPVIALGNIDATPEDVPYLVAGNCTGRKSVSWFLDRMGKALKEAPKPAPEEAAK